MQEQALTVARGIYGPVADIPGDRKKIPGLDLSIVIPVYNSEKTIGILVGRLQSLLRGRLEFDIILVNDCSADHSLSVLMDIFDRYDNVKVVNLSRNFGEHGAVMAGLNLARGAYVITMDDDLQNPAEEALKLIGEAEKGYDVVYAQYLVKRQSLLRNAGSEVNDLMARLLIKKPRGMKLNSFRLIRSYVVKEVIKYKAPYPYIDGLILRVTRNLGTVTVEHRERQVGRSNYTFKKLVGLWLNGFLNFSIAPLRLFVYAGCLFAAAGFLSAIAIVLDTLILRSEVPGWTSLITSTLVFSGIQLLSIGMMGEYIGRMFLTQNMTPQYVVKDVASRE